MFGVSKVLWYNKTNQWLLTKKKLTNGYLISDDMEIEKVQVLILSCSRKEINFSFSSIHSGLKNPKSNPISFENFEVIHSKLYSCILYI